MLNVYYCLNILLFTGTPFISATPKECLKATAFQVAAEEGVDPFIFIAIVEHESRWKVSAYNKRSRDYGLAQINEYNVKALKLDKRRLLQDPEYNLRVGARILARIQRRYGHEHLYWTRFNVGYGKLGPKRQELALKYSNKVMKNLNRGIASL